MHGNALRSTISDLKEKAALEVYVHTPEGHQLVHGVKIVRFDGKGPFVLEISTDPEVAEYEGD